MSREAMKHALEALEQIDGAMPFPVCRNAITALRQALEHPADEPLGYFQYAMHLDAWVQNRDENKGVALYTRPQPAAQELTCVCGAVWQGEEMVCAPHKKPAAWVGLTDEEVDDIWNRYCDEMGEASINDAQDIANAIEKALKEKNT